VKLDEAAEGSWGDGNMKGLDEVEDEACVKESMGTTVEILLSEESVTERAWEGSMASGLIGGNEDLWWSPFPPGTFIWT